MIKKAFLLLLGAGLFACCAQAPTYEEEMAQKAQALLQQMTLEEKIGQMVQISYEPSMAPMVNQILPQGQIGSLLNVVDPEEVNRLQKIAVEESRLGIPLLIGRDVIHGFSTVMPIPLGMAATFNPALVEEGARRAAQEATAVGVRWTFSPMLDIARDPRWGRIAEGSGEDPFLDAQMGVALTRGYQGTPPYGPTSMAACVKHYAGYGAAEGGRDYASTFLTERQLRNIYLPPFEAAIRQGGALTVMTSFNDNDGVPSTANTFLLQDVLRREWGFDGFVVSDWNSIGEMVAHGFAADHKEAARLAAKAGCDMDMMAFAYAQHLKELVETKQVPLSAIDRAVKGILTVKYKLGLFEQPYVDASAAAAAQGTPEALETARQLAVESAILLKNNGALPLDSHVKTVLVTGPMAHAAYEQMGTWVFDGNASAVVSALDGLQRLYGHRVKFLYEPALSYSREQNAAGIRKAVALAAKADAILVFVGEEAILSGEGHSLAHLELQGDQDRLVEALKNTGKKVITTVMAGRPLAIAPTLSHSDALLYMFHPGTMGGVALAQLLFGDEVPSGRTPITFPLTAGQTPIYYAHNNTGRPYQGFETLLDNIPLQAGQTSLGNTSYYLDVGAFPLFPFGYGLSYTTFQYSDITLDKTTYARHDPEISVNVTLTNTGTYPAEEVVQVYVRDLVGSVTRPVKELKAFERVPLKAGESRTLTLKVPMERLAFWNLDGEYAVEPGDFQLWVAPHSAAGNPVTFCIK